VASAGIANDAGDDEMVAGTGRSVEDGTPLVEEGNASGGDGDGAEVGAVDAHGVVAGFGDDAGELDVVVDAEGLDLLWAAKTAGRHQGDCGDEEEGGERGGELKSAAGEQPGEERLAGVEGTYFDGRGGVGGTVALEADAGGRHRGGGLVGDGVAEGAEVSSGGEEGLDLGALFGRGVGGDFAGGEGAFEEVVEAVRRHVPPPV
jgi:hypothetical protein